jgi:EAL domain-containing protein (putative c-di-GMP-specific phosphodiesterase class I)
MASAAYEALVLESQLALAVERGEFELHYQPQVRAADSALVGAEALIRWRHPERGLLGPDTFIPVAEQRRLMRGIGRWTLRQALRTAQGWHRAGLPPVPVAVNLSSVEFHAAGFVDSVAEVLHEEGVGGDLLELELTERMLMDDVAEVKRLLARLKALGIRIAIDDFGTGYSSLGHLKDLPIDKIKIDRSFVQDLPRDPGSAAIARAIVQLARGLGRVVIAEGVETEVQRRFLLELGCDELQGELVSRPLPAKAFARWVGAHVTA